VTKSWISISFIADLLGYATALEDRARPIWRSSDPTFAS
jgi:hypothetical protein